jgi:hypothetical protein
MEILKLYFMLPIQEALASEDQYGGTGGSPKFLEIILILRHLSTTKLTFDN